MPTKTSSERVTFERQTLTGQASRISEAKDGRAAVHFLVDHGHEITCTDVSLLLELALRSESGVHALKHDEANGRRVVFEIEDLLYRQVAPYPLARLVDHFLECNRRRAAQFLVDNLSFFDGEEAVDSMAILCRIAYQEPESKIDFDAIREAIFTEGDPLSLDDFRKIVWDDATELRRLAYFLEHGCENISAQNYWVDESKMMINDRLAELDARALESLDPALKRAPSRPSL